MGQLLRGNRVAGRVPMRVIDEINRAARSRGLFQSRGQIEKMNSGGGAEVPHHLILGETIFSNIRDPKRHVIVTADKIERALEVVPA